MTHPRPSSNPPERAQGAALSSDREQGAALIIVLVFMLGIAAMVAYLVPTAQKNYESEGINTRRRGLEMLLQHAINDVIQESKSNVDSDAAANGIGAVGVDDKASWTGGGNFSDYGTGTIVTVQGRRLGAYMAVVRTDPANSDLQIVNIVAAYPDFASPREMIGAQVQVQTSLQGLFGDRSAISFAGDLSGSSTTGGGNFGWANNGDQSVEIVSTSTYDPDGAGPLSPIYAPAVNISDQDFYDGFMNEFVNDPNHGEGTAGDGLTIEGGDTTNSLLSTTATITDTISQEPSSTQRVNEDFLRQWIEHWRDAGNQTPDNSFNSSNTSQTLNNGTDKLYFLTANQLKSGAVIQGQGTLIIRGDLTMTQNSKIDWNGDVIVIPQQANGSGNLIVKDATLNVTGSLVLAPNPDFQAASVSLQTQHADAAINVTGTLLAIQAGLSSANIDINKGGSLKVDGLLGMLGNDVGLQVSGEPGALANTPGRGELEVTGSTVVAVPPGGSGLQKLRFDAASTTRFSFDNALFEQGVQLAEEGSQHSDVEPPPYTVYQTGYREVPAQIVLAQFEAVRNDASDAAGISVPE